MTGEKVCWELRRAPWTDPVDDPEATYPFGDFPLTDDAEHRARSELDR